MISVGDIVVVTLDAEVALLSWGQASQLQTKLQQLGFAVVRFDDSGLSYSLHGILGPVVITVQPLVSAYENQSDVAAVVAGAAYDAGYYVHNFSSQHLPQYAEAGDANTIDYGNAVDPWTGQPTQTQSPAQKYQQNLQTPVFPSSQNPDDSLGSAFKKFGEGLGAGSTLTIALLALVGIVLLKR